MERTVRRGYPLPVLDADKIVEEVRGLGVECFVTTTGGNTATIYAGGMAYTDDDGEARWAASCGPGTFRWGDGPNLFDHGELYVGPDDDGEATPVECYEVGAWTERDVAMLIVAQVAYTEPREAVGAVTLKALGFDSTMQGRERLRPEGAGK